MLRNSKERERPKAERGPTGRRTRPRQTQNRAGLIVINGPGGDFSWVIPAGTVQILDTTTDVIVGGPNGVPTTSQTIINGVVDVVDLVQVILNWGPC